MQGWLNELPSLGRATIVSDFLASKEFRTDAVQQLYGDPLAELASTALLLLNLLHRTSPPPSVDVNSGVNSGMDLLSMEAIFAATSEFFSNG